MSEHEKDHEANPDASQPVGGGLPDESPTAGEAALEKDGVEVEGPKTGKGGDETHGAGEHGKPSG